MFVVFDIETTGFSDLNNDIIEFAYIAFDENNNYVKAEQLYFYYEGMSWSEEAYNVHKIPLDFLREHKDKFKENCVKMFSILHGNNVVGHNAIGFDCPFVRNWLMRMGIGNLQYASIQDTMKAYKPITKKSRIKLTKLIDYIDITPENIEMLMQVWFPNSAATHAHEAAYDTTATALLTLRAIDKHLINFELPTKTQDTVVDMGAFYDSNNSTESFETPVIFKYRLEDDLEEEVHYICFSTPRTCSIRNMMTPTDKDLSEARSSNRVFPITLICGTTADVYSAECDGVTYTLDCTGDFDIFTGKTVYGEFECENADLLKIILNLKEKGNS